MSSSVVAAPAPTIAKPAYNRRLTCAYGVEGSPISNSMDLLSELVNEASNGRIIIDAYYAGAS